jgi:Ca-activated chloride channel family protein
MRRITPTIPLLLALPLGAAASAPAFAADSAMIVLDASGSMAGQLTGKPKIAMARDTLTSVLTDTPEKLALGLLAYGHRQKASCSDIELLVPPATGSSRAILDAAKTVVPRGKAPLAASIEQAAQELNYQEQKATIIVVTDGADNCTGDPCAIAGDLKATGADFTIHVIGFGLKEADKEAVACLADATGGLYLDAGDQAGLSAALTQAVKVEPEVPLPTASISAPVSVDQRAEFNVAYDGPKEDGDQIHISWPGSRPGQYLRNVRVRADGKPAHLTAPAESGDYEIRYWLPSRGKVIAQTPIRVEEIGVKLSGPESVDQGAEFDVAWSGRSDPNGVIEIVPLGGGAPFSSVRARGSPVRLDAPGKPGSYLVRYRMADEVGATLALSVAEKPASLDAPASAAGGADFSVGWTGPGGSFDEIQLAPAPTPDGSRIEYARAAEAGVPAVLTAPLQAGTYELRYWSSRSRMVMARRSIEVAAVAASLDVPGSIEGGASLAVNWTGPAARFDEIQIAPSSAAGGEAVTRADIGAGGSTTLAAPLAAGEYEARYWSGEWRVVLARKAFTVRAPSVTLNVPGASVSAGSRFAVGWTGPAGRYDDIRIVRPGSAPEESIHAARLGKAGETVELLAPTEPGSYELRYWSDSGRRVLGTLPVTVE